MAESYSYDAQLTLKRARTEAQRLGLKEVHADCLLLGLVQDETLIGENLLILGTDVVAAKIRHLQPTTAPADLPSDLPFAWEARKILYVAFAEANKWNHSQVQNIHILKAILHPSHEDNSGLLLLQACGANIDAMRIRTENHLSLLRQDVPYVRDPRAASSAEDDAKMDALFTPLWRREPTQPAQPTIENPYQGQTPPTYSQPAPYPSQPAYNSPPQASWLRGEYWGPLDQHWRQFPADRSKSWPAFAPQPPETVQPDIRESAMEKWFTTESSLVLLTAKNLAQQSGASCINRSHLLKALYVIKDARLFFILDRMPALSNITEYIDQSAKEEPVSEVPPFSNGAIRVLRLARAEARSFSEGEKIQPEIILYSLLLDEAALLKEAYTVHDQLLRQYALERMAQRQIADYRKRQDRLDPHESRMRFSTQLYSWRWLRDSEVPVTIQVMKILKAAREEAVTLGSSTVKSLHLVLGILTQAASTGLLPWPGKEAELTEEIRKILRQQLQDQPPTEMDSLQEEDSLPEEDSAQTEVSAAAGWLRPEDSLQAEETSLQAEEQPSLQTKDPPPAKAAQLAKDPPESEDTQKGNEGEFLATAGSSQLAHSVPGLFTDYVRFILQVAGQYAEQLEVPCIDLNHVTMAINWVNGGQLYALSEFMSSASTEDFRAGLRCCFTAKRTEYEIDLDFAQIIDLNDLNGLFKESSEETESTRQQESEKVVERQETPAQRSQKQHAKNRQQSESTTLHEFFSVRTKKLLDRAREEASLLNEKRIAIEHMVLALMYDITSPSSEALYAIGITYEQAREKLADLKPHDFNRHSCNRGLTARAQSLLKEALTIMTGQHRNSIEPEHIMLAIIEEHNRLALLLFEALEIDAEQLRTALECVINARVKVSASVI